MAEKAVFTLTTVGEDRAAGRMRRRTVGFFWTVEQAEDMLVQDYGDLDESGGYRWAVIEEVPPGLYPTSRRARWWEHDPRADRWRPLDRCPEPVRAYCDTHHVINQWCEIG